MLKDLLPFLKDPYAAIIASVQWLALIVFYAIDTTLPLIGLLAVTMISSFIVMFVSLKKRS